MVSVISTWMFDVSYAVEVLVFMFAGGVRFHTSVVFLIQSVVVVACVILIPGFSHVVGIGSEYFVVYLLCVYIC